jgi:octaprenyl-diphosphate synthase
MNRLVETGVHPEVPCRPAPARVTLRPLQALQAEQDLTLIETELAAVCGQPASRIEHAACHALDGGGKRARPRLTTTVLRALGCDPSPHLGLVIAVELAHAGSLLHDDVIDDSATRRGRPAGHVAFDVPTAILAGDLLLTLAMERVAGRGPRRLQVALAVAVRQLSQGASLERERLFDDGADPGHARTVNRLKTAALFAYAAEAGAILAGAEPPVCGAARAYGLALGQAFQTTDDLLDLQGDPTRLGKPVGQDLVAGEITLPVAMALEREPELRHVVREVWRRTRANADTSALLLELRDRMVASGTMAAAVTRAEDDAAAACARLAGLPAGPWRDALHELALSAVARQN